MIHKMGNIGGSEPKTPDGLDRDGKPYRVLVVDDSEMMRKMIIQVLKSEAYEVCGEAMDGENAITLYKELRPDVVTLDIKMPILDGLTTLQQILDYDKNARVVMLSSQKEKIIVMQALELGAKNYISKPPHRKSIIERVKSALK
ncbi:response regulator [Spirochaetota bacterium]